MKQTIAFFLLFTTYLSAQIKCKVVDENNKPIPYVNIWVENENIGTTSEENGEFSINTTNDKILVFSAFGFETKKTKVVDNEKVILQTVVYKLDEVVVLKLKKTKEIEVGNTKNRFYLPEPQTVPWILAKKINLDPDNLEAKYVKNIIFFTKSEVDNAIFRVRIFKINKDGLPEEDLVSEEIIVKTKKGRHETIVDVSSYKLEIPQEGIIVGFESLLTQGNKYLEKSRIKDSKKHIFIDNFGPHILYSFIDTETSYVFKFGIWAKQLFSQRVEKNKILAPAIKLTLTN